MAEYKVQFEVFEGPLDLLLYLVKKEEVDIYEINLTKVATQFVEYIEMMRQFDLEVAGEFLVMAATLMYIKSRELLPVEKQAVVEEEDEEDPRWELIRQLVEYRKYKDAAASLQNLEAEQEQVYNRQPPQPELEPEPTPSGPEASIFDLLGAVNKILKRFNEKKGPPAREIFEDKWSVSEKIELLRDVIHRERAVRFSQLFAETTSRAEVVVTFLALLELIRLHQLCAVQNDIFGEIEIQTYEPPQPADATDNDSEPGPAHATTPTEAPHGTEARP
jgi:segregation and condensation protein A